MSYILNIETSTSVCSTALCQEGNVIFANKSTEGPSHSVLLGTFVAETLEFIKNNELKLEKLDNTLENADIVVFLVAHKEFKTLLATHHSVLAIIDFCGVTN